MWTFWPPSPTVFTSCPTSYIHSCLFSLLISFLQTSIFSPNALIDLLKVAIYTYIFQMIKRLWCWERLKAGGEGDDRGWDGWMASLTQWTWVWVNSRSWWWAGRPGVLQSMGSQRVGHNLVTQQQQQNTLNNLVLFPHPTQIFLPLSIGLAKKFI